MSLIGLSLPWLRQKRLAVEGLGVAAGAGGLLRALVHRDSGVLAARVNDVEVYTEGGIAVSVEKTFLDGVGLDAPEGFHARVLRRAAAAHLFDDEERAEVVEIRLASSGRPGNADRAVYVEPRAEDGRVAD